MEQYKNCGPNMFLQIYDSTEAHIGAVISQLFYRTFVKMLPDYQIESKPDPELCLKDVLEVLDWLFEEVQMSPDKNPYATDVCFLCRIPPKILRTKKTIETEKNVSPREIFFLHIESFLQNYKFTKFQKLPNLLDLLIQLRVSNCLY